MQRDGGVGDDYACVTLLYGQKRVVLSADCFGMRPQVRFRLAGTRGEYVVEGADPQEGQLRGGLNPSQPEFGASTLGRVSLLTTASGEVRDVPVAAGRYLEFYEVLKRAILTGGPVPVRIEEAVQVVGLIDALREQGEWEPALTG